MARSYLARLAQPLTTADPVVWSTPRATLEESRPPAPAPARVAPTMPGATTARAMAAGESPPVAEESAEPAKHGVTAEPRTSAEPVVTAEPIARADLLPMIDRVAREPGGKHTMPPAGATGSVPPIAARSDPARHSDHPARQPTGADAASAEAAAPVLPEASSARPHSGVIVTPTPRGVPVPSPIAVSDPALAERQGAAHAYDMPSIETGPAARADAGEASPPRARGADPEMPEPAPRAPLPHPPARPEAPRLHIGSIEIRVQQPVPPAAPPAIAAAPPIALPAAVPIARGYTSRFGLAQA